VILAIDAGNSRLKWGVFDADGELRAHGICPNMELGTEAPVAWGACKRAVISNVAGEAIAEKLNVLLRPLDIPTHWIAASTQACSVKNSYTNPQQLGTDRWAALIAAWRHYHAPCVVVNAGTALTVDALGVDKVTGHGIFLGGLIVPGFNLMRTSLIKATAGINEAAGSAQDFPVNTADALYGGILSAIVGAVESMVTKLQRREAESPRCVVTGGDATLLAEALKDSGMANNVVIADNLVLQGLLELEKSA
jgi:type III pantothenate kinase